MPSIFIALRHLYKRTLRRRQKCVKIGSRKSGYGICDVREYGSADGTVISSGGSDEEMLLLSPLDTREDNYEEPKKCDLPPVITVTSGCNHRWLDELDRMQRELDTIGDALRAQVDRLDMDHRRRLEHCAKHWFRGNTRHDQSNNVFASWNRRKMEALTEECRLRGALLAEKFRNCVDYLQGFDAQINAIHRQEHRQQQQRQKNEEGDFLREFLLKTARSHQQKGQLGQAVIFQLAFCQINIQIFKNSNFPLDTFCQLLLATDGRLRRTEMELLAEVCREKIRHTSEFHERISGAVHQQLDESPTLRGNFVVQEMWAQLLEDLRSECADAYDIVMRVRCNDVEEAQNVEQLKLLMATNICALWLHITPYEHEEHDELKELFFRTLDQYIGTFRVTKNADQLSEAVRELIRDYPNVAESKKMRKIVRILFKEEKN